MVADRLISPTGVIHFGLLMVSCDHLVTRVFARQVAAAAKKCE